MDGLTEAEAADRLKQYGYNEPSEKERRNVFRQILSKFLNPLVVVLVLIGAFSLFFGERAEAVLILLMILMSVFLSFIQEYRSGKEAEKLQEMIRTTATVVRDGRETEINIREIVPDDVVELRAGDMIPADIRILRCKDFFVNQAALTGESFPVEKFPGVSSDADAFMGCSVVSGTARGLVVRTGAATKFGEISRKLSEAAEESDFDKGINSFVLLAVRLTAVLVLVIFAINFGLKRNFLESLLFSLAVAVGLTPELLPVIVTVNLSKGAIAMSKKKVIVKRLNAIQGLGAMDVLCTDKTGTLTLNQVVLEKHCDVAGRESEDVLNMAYVNSFHQTGLRNLLDQAILRHERFSAEETKKVDEIPFDFSRRIMTIVVETAQGNRLISKGAPEEIFKRCAYCEIAGKISGISGAILSDVKEEYDKLSADGFRVLALAYADVPQKAIYSKEDEKGLILKGYLAFLDPPKPSARETIQELETLGIRFVVLTGDNELVTKKVCREVGLDEGGLVNGDRIDDLDEEELSELVKTNTVFARLSPSQKERVILVLRRHHHSVGYLGDGINDATSLKAANVGISVDNAADVAKESADIILLEKNLLVLRDGVLEGRRTFGNTVKYIRMGASSNFGNMISMTGASLFLPFLPMMPIQILFNNFLYDVSQVAIPTDAVDPEYLEKPRPWDIGSLRRFMLVFGPVSSLFDFLTFGLLLFVFRAPAPVFRTGWFLESLVTQTIVIHVIRTAKVPVLESRASGLLIFTSCLVIAAGIGAALSPVGKYFGFAAPPAPFFPTLGAILAAYIVASQCVKTWYFKKYGY